MVATHIPNGFKSIANSLAKVSSQMTKKYTLTDLTNRFTNYRVRKWNYMYSGNSGPILVVQFVSKLDSNKMFVIGLQDAKVIFFHNVDGSLAKFSTDMTTFNIWENITVSRRSADRQFNALVSHKPVKDFF